MRLEQVEKRRPLREDQRLVVLGDDLLERFQQDRELRGGLRRLARDQGRVAGGLAQAQQGLQRLHDPAARVEPLDDGRQRGGAHGVVDVALLLRQLRVEHGVGAGRQLGCDVPLQPSQYERS